MISLVSIVHTFQSTSTGLLSSSICFVNRFLCLISSLMSSKHKDIKAGSYLTREKVSLLSAFSKANGWQQNNIIYAGTIIICLNAPSNILSSATTPASVAPVLLRTVTGAGNSSWPEAAGSSSNPVDTGGSKFPESTIVPIENT